MTKDVVLFCLAEPDIVDVLKAVAMNGYRQGWSNSTAKRSSNPEWHILQTICFSFSYNEN
jgi:hypothetical protein